MDRLAADAIEQIGFNSEASFRNLTFHIQTQNLANQPRPVINTLVFLRGTLVHKLSSTYADLSDGPDFESAVELRVKSQHQEALTRVMRGDFVPK